MLKHDLVNGTYERKLLVLFYESKPRSHSMSPIDSSQRIFLVDTTDEKRAKSKTVKPLHHEFMNKQEKEWIK